MSEVPLYRFRAKCRQLQWFYGVSQESQDLNLVVTVLYVPSSLHSGDEEFVVRSQNLREDLRCMVVSILIRTTGGPGSLHATCLFEECGYLGSKGP